MRNECACNDIKIALQPIIRLADHKIIAFEALARDSIGNARTEWITLKGADERARFDYLCRRTALEHAISIGLSVPLTVNIGAGSLCHPFFGIDATLLDASKLGWPVDKLIVELTEQEQIPSLSAAIAILSDIRRKGIKWAIDDFATGSCRLALISRVPPDYIKLSKQFTLELTRTSIGNIILDGLMKFASAEGGSLIAEEIETREEEQCIADMGIPYAQGNYFGRPELHESDPLRDCP